MSRTRWRHQEAKRSQTTAQSSSTQVLPVSEEKLDKPTPTPTPEAPLTPEAEERRLLRAEILRPFVSYSWFSNEWGPLVIDEGVSPGRLKVIHREGGQQFGRELWMEDGVALHLNSTEEQLVMHSADSHPKRQVVWKDAEGKYRETWVNFGSQRRGPLGEGKLAGKLAEWGHTALLDGKFDQALELYNQVLDEETDVRTKLQAFRNRCHCFLNLNNLDEALQDAENAVALDKSSWVGHDALGLCKFAAQDYAASVEAYLAAVQRTEGKDAGGREEGLRTSLQRFLLRKEVPELKRTFDARGLPLRSLWESCTVAKTGHRQFAQVLPCTSVASRPQLPFILTLPETPKVGKRYPLLVYLHSAGTTDICSGDVQLRQLQFVAQESPMAVLLEKARPSVADRMIGVAPCCPSNLGQLDASIPKGRRRRKLFWFKSCDAGAYQDWNFSNASRCMEVESIIVELLAHICAELPVDPTRIFFLGVSCGGYGVLRLAELLPSLPALVVPMAGYYPTMVDHDVSVMAERLRGVNLKPYHCERDKLCRLDSPHVHNMYRVLHDQNQVEVERVADKVARGSNSNFHSVQQEIFASPDQFFLGFTECRRKSMSDAVAYLRERLAELRAAQRQFQLQQMPEIEV